jgi:hypothetical protein
LYDPKAKNITQIMKKTLALAKLLSILTLMAGAQSTELLYLSGTGFDHTVAWDFFCTAGMNSGTWTKIDVPSCWEQQGFGQYNYGHVPFEQRLKEEGHYRCAFTAPPEWKGKHIRIIFEGVMTDCAVFLNGKPAGPVHQGGFYRFGYDVSRLLKFGTENLLEVNVKKFSDNESVNQAERKADFWIFGGIFRPVYLEIKPVEHIERVAIDARADGSCFSEVYLSAGRKASLLMVKILDADGKEKARFSSPVESKSGLVSILGKMAGAKPWTPEFPHLYTASFTLLDALGKPLHEMSERIGFRTVEVREQDGIYVNDVRIKYKGVDRHTFHPEHARTSSKSLSIEVVNLIKDMNMNAVRMSHYPPDPHFLDVCDSMGLFVLDELAGWQRPPYDSVVGRELLKEMIVRDVNHPCVVMWDNGNEGGWNTTYDKDFKKLDIQQREVIHPWGAFEKTNTAHYVEYDYLSLDHFAPRSIFFPTELLHGLYDGGLGAGLEDFWLRMWHHPLCAGGFLWVFADEAVKRTDTGVLDTDGNHAPDGILGPYHEKEGSFYTIREVWSPVFIEERYITPEFNGLFNIENRFFYTGLDQCSFSNQWIKYPGPGEPVAMVPGKPVPAEVLAKGIPAVDPLKPMQRGKLDVPKPENWLEADALLLEAHDPYGRLIHTWTWPVKSPGAKAAELLPDSAPDRSVDTQAIRLEEVPDRLILEASGTRIELSKKTGMLEKVSSSGTLVPLSGGFIAGKEIPPLKALEHFMKDNTLHVRADFEDQSVFEWILHEDGLLDLKARYSMDESKVPFAGISFNYPEDQIKEVNYLGNGPYRVWENRMKGGNFGVWDKPYNNTITGHAGYIYPEFKGYFSNLYWATFCDADDHDFTVYCRSDDIFLRLFSPEESPDPAKTTVNHPPGDISFMHGIPAIGTKFKEAGMLGPQSRPYQYNYRRIPGGALSLELTFDFGSDK